MVLGYGHQIATRSRERRLRAPAAIASAAPHTRMPHALCALLAHRCLMRLAHRCLMRLAHRCLAPELTRARWVSCCAVSLLLHALASQVERSHELITALVERCLHERDAKEAALAAKEAALAEAAVVRQDAKIRAL